MNEFKFRIDSFGVKRLLYVNFKLCVCVYCRDVHVDRGK